MPRPPRARALTRPRRTPSITEGSTSSSERLQSTAARGVRAITAPQPRCSARQTSRSTSGSSSVVRDGFPPVARATSQSGYSRPECGTESRTGKSPRGSWMVGEGSLFTVLVKFRASLGLAEGACNAPVHYSLLEKGLIAEHRSAMARILLAEDDTSMREYLQRALQRVGY